MDPIKPDQDEVESFQRKRPAGRSISIERDSSRPGSARASSEGPPLHSSGSQYSAGGRGVSGTLVAALFVALTAFAAFNWWQLQSRNEVIDRMTDQLSRSRQALDRSQLILARLDGRVTRTDETMAQSGNELARALQKLDSQVVKQGDRVVVLTDQMNAQRKALASELQAVREQVTKASNDELARLELQIEKRLGEIEATASRVSAEVATVTADMKARENLPSALQSLEARVDALPELAALDRAVAQADALGKQRTEDRRQLEARIDESSRQLEQKIELFGKRLQSFERRLDTAGSGSDLELRDLKERVEAIDATRRQLVQRFMGLDQRVDALER